MDGTDCPIEEPKPFSGKWFSHKFKGSGLRYEVGLSIFSGELIWIYGPFPCGQYPDLSIFRMRMKQLLLPGERTVADNGYRDPACAIPEQFSGDSTHKRIRARHEIVNWRLKKFFVLSHKFRHDLSRHSACFHAIAELAKLELAREPLFSI